MARDHYNSMLVQETGATPRSPFARLLLGLIESANTVLTESVRDVDEQTRRLSELFQSLTDNSTHQTDRLASLVEQIASVEHDGKRYDLVSFPAILQNSLQEVTERILVLSKQGVSLIYSLDEILTEIEEVGSCISEIEAINKQTRLLSLNAQIEAGRAGAAGAGFQIVSTEMHALSRRIDALSERMRCSVDKVTSSIREVITSIKTEYQELSEIGAMDLTNQIDAKEQLEILLQALISRNDDIQSVLGATTDVSRRIGEEIREVVVAMQFQDRLQQRSDAVVNAFEQISRFMDAHPQLLADDTECEALCSNILGAITLSEVRQEFSRNLGVEDNQEPPVGEAGGAIELF